MTIRRFFRRLPVPLLWWRRALGPHLLLASVLATGIAAPPAWGQNLDPVLFVHGFGDCGSIWDTLRNDLQTNHGYPPQYLRAISLSADGTTYSICPDGVPCACGAQELTGSNKTVANSIAGAVQELLTATGKTRVDIVSHSMGGLSTRWYIAQVTGAAERVDTWITLAGANHGTNWDVPVGSGFCSTKPSVSAAAREVCPAFIEDPDPAEGDVTDPNHPDKFQLTLNGIKGFKNPNNVQDETPYGFGEDNQLQREDNPPAEIPWRNSVTRQPPTATRRVFYATIRCGDEVILPNESTAVDGAGGRTIDLTGLPAEESSPGNFRMTQLTDCHETIHQNPAVRQLVARLLQTNTTVVNFDKPAPDHGRPACSGCGGFLDGLFDGIDFGTGQWAWEGVFNSDLTNNIYFRDSTGTSRTFQFSLAPRVLSSMRVFTANANAGTLTLSDNQGQTLTQVVTPGSMQPVVTNWTLPSTTVTVDFTDGWALGIDDITYKR